MRTRRPFPDVEERDPEALGAVIVDPPAMPDYFPEHEAETATEAGGFTAHTAENRKARRAGVATWTPPAQEENAPRMPTRRELLKQRKRNQRGTTDPALRRLQRKAISERAR